MGNGENVNAAAPEALGLGFAAHGPPNENELAVATRAHHASRGKTRRYFLKIKAPNRPLKINKNTKSMILAT